jgi:antitoxin component of RelBE/YafQ-DinJ toxin-antitoxin module
MAEHTQVKVSVDSDVASAFKAYCKDSGLTITGELSRFMASCVKSAAADPSPLKTGTRGARRKAVNAVICTLRRICDAEAAYLDNIPENLRSGAACEASDLSVEALGEAIDILTEAF